MLAGAGVLAVVGVVLVLIAGASDWGPPGSLAYAGYERMNRWVALPWLGTVVVLVVLLRWPPRAGVAVAFIGAALVLGGIVGEFWVWTELSYRDPARSFAYSTSSLGHLVFLIGYGLAWTKLGRLRFPDETAECTVETLPVRVEGATIEGAFAVSCPAA